MSINYSSEETADIRSVVREHYSKAANRAAVECGCAGGCCGSDQAIPLDAISSLYQAEDVAGLPQEVTELSMGCGDPVTLASLQLGETVLDLGSGGGIDCFLAARRVGEQGRVIGVDMTAEMLEIARANQRRLAIPNVEFRLGEIEHLPVGDNSVDVILSNCVINLSPDKLQVFREAYRVLRTGGRFAVSDIVTDGPLPEAVRSSLVAWAGCIAGALDIREYTSAMQMAGFKDIQIEPVYWGEAEISSALGELSPDETGDLDKRALSRCIFSARIRARKL
jgi:arsenite methyltransferase